MDRKTGGLQSIGSQRAMTKGIHNKSRPYSGKCGCDCKTNTSITRTYVLNTLKEYWNALALTVITGGILSRPAQTPWELKTHVTCWLGSLDISYTAAYDGGTGFVSIFISSLPFTITPYLQTNKILVVSILFSTPMTTWLPISNWGVQWAHSLVLWGSLFKIPIWDRWQYWDRWQPEDNSELERGGLDGKWGLPLIRVPV